jgi:hypothetical protein
MKKDYKKITEDMVVKVYDLLLTNHGKKANQE